MPGLTNDVASLGAAAQCLRGESADDCQPRPARHFVRASGALDAQLQLGFERLLEDFRAQVTAPMLEGINGAAKAGEQGRGSDRRRSGIEMLGHASIVVTSGLEAAITAKLAGSVPSVIPKPLGSGILDLAFPRIDSSDPSGTARTTKTTTEKDGKVTESTVTEVTETKSVGDPAAALSGTAKVMSGLSNLEAIGLAAALLSPAEPGFTAVAPGITVNVQPHVLPGGELARIQMSTQFGVETTPPGARGDAWADAPLTAVRLHTVDTDVAVTAFDLFTVSSFSVSTSVPRSRLVVPILGRLPVIGPAFQFPRGPKQTRYESVLVVQASILPRAIDLVDLDPAPPVEAAPSGERQDPAQAR